MSPRPSFLIRHETTLTPSLRRRTEEQKQADGQELMDFCAECLGRFISDHYGDDDGNVILEEPLALGFTFSYPCM